MRKSGGMTFSDSESLNSESMTCGFAMDALRWNTTGSREGSNGCVSDAWPLAGT